MVDWRTAWATAKLISIGDCLKDTTLHTAVYKFQSERGAPHAYGPDKLGNFGMATAKSGAMRMYGAMGV